MTKQDEAYAHGTLRKTTGGYFAQFSLGRGQRKGGTIACESLAEAERRQLAVAQLVARLRQAGYRAAIPNVIRDACAADADELRNVSRLVHRIIAGKEPGLVNANPARRQGLTVKDLAALWTSGELSKLYPDHVKLKRSRADDARIFKWLGKVRMQDGVPFGERVVSTVTLDDADHLMTALPSTAQTPATRRHYAQALRKLLTYAVYPLRLLTALPIPKGWLPKGKSDKAKSWIYPHEDLALMRQRSIPVGRRVFYGFLAREGLRVNEARKLTWSDVDLELGVIRLDQTKTDEARTWALAPDVARALAAWREVRPKEARKKLIFPSAAIGDRWALADNLREGLEIAGVKRPELGKSTKSRMRLRAHDLRGTFVTLALAAGRTEAWVTDRTGHKSSAMIYRYKRASRTAAELRLGWLAPLDEAIPELAFARQGANGVQTGGPRGRQTSRGGSKTSRKARVGTPRGMPSSTLNPLADSSSLSWPTINDSEGLWPPSRGPLEGEDSVRLHHRLHPLAEDLERRLVEAELAGRQTVADALARRLEELRERKQAVS
jgi:integrase